MSLLSEKLGRVSMILVKPRGIVETLFPGNGEVNLCVVTNVEIGYGLIHWNR